MARRLSLSLGSVGVVGAVVWVGVAGSRTLPAAQIDKALVDLDTTVRETAAGVQARAIKVSQLPGLDSAIATDEGTVRDLMTEEVTFRPQPGESIEIAQVERVGGAVHRLMILPTDGRSALAASTPGLHLVADRDNARVAAVIQIEPRGREQIVSGLIGVVQRVDLSRVAQHFEALGIAVRLQTSGGTADIGTTTWNPKASTIERALQSPAAVGAKVILQVPRGIAWGHVTGAMLLLFASMVSAVLLARRGGRATGHPPAPPAPRTSEQANALALDSPELPTRVGHAGGTLGSSSDETPASRGPHDLDVTSSGVQPVRKTLRGVQAPEVPGATATTIPSAMFVVDAASPVDRAPVLPDPNDPWTAEFKRLFKEFVKLRRTCNESTEDLDRDRFIEALHKKRLELVHQNSAVDVTFRVAFDNGKAAVRVKVQDPQPPPGPVR